MAAKPHRDAGDLDQAEPRTATLKHRLRKLRRDRRRRMRRLAKAHRSTRNDHVHRNAQLGSRRSAAMTVGSLHEAAASSGLCALQLGPHRRFFSTSGGGRRQQSGATLALTLRAAQCIKRRFYPATKGRALTLVVRTRCIAEGRNAKVCQALLFVERPI